MAKELVHFHFADTLISNTQQNDSINFEFSRQFVSKKSKILFREKCKKSHKNDAKKAFFITESHSG